jgi:hypothetical protein
MPNARQTPPACLRLRERLRSVESLMREFGPELATLTELTANGMLENHLSGPGFSRREQIALNLAVTYANAAVALANVGSRTGSLEPAPDRN